MYSGPLDEVVADAQSVEAAGLKVASVPAGVSTIGSRSLVLVFGRSGTPVLRCGGPAKAGLAWRATVWTRAVPSAATTAWMTAGMRRGAEIGAVKATVPSEPCLRSGRACRKGHVPSWSRAFEMFVGAEQA